MDTNKIYELGNKIGQRFAFGSAIHHPSLATAYEALELPQFAQMNKEASLKETKKRLYTDCLIVELTGRVPKYSLQPNIQSAMDIMGNLSKEQILQNKSELLKRLIALQENYEKETVNMLEQLKEIGKEAGDKFNHFIAKVIENVKDELKEIEINKQILEKTGFDPEKIKKGDTSMEHEHEMARRHRAERDELDRRHAHEMRRHYGEYGNDYESPMGYDMRRGRHYSVLPYLPTGDYEQEHEMRRRRYY